ncbi:hypothetical protein OG763_28150 [Streptomyces sp. NBC_01230]|uniref:hypothetical protein n=1 Tax=Streptomyces sp. NBC_01230 TaxID=2903784 RepID=UPI002E12A758|nr:hypothetical protein OG763_28150 [Streptomyces sp. NBC_01230]
MSVRTARARSTRARVRAAAGLTVLLGACLIGCSSVETSEGPGGDVPYVAPSANEAAASRAAEARAEADAKASADAEDAARMSSEKPATTPPQVRDAFATLQATLDDTCTPGAGDCAYVLGRVHDELAGLEASMKAHPKDPGHFKEPVAWMTTLDRTLKGDTSTENLEKHRSELFGTRDRINTWMQGHPEDYR